MQAVIFRLNPVGWATCRALRRLWRRCLTSRLGGLSLEDTPLPELPGDDWVRVRTLMAGICGSDLAVIGQKMPPDSILQAFSSTPAGMGHENVAVVEEVGPSVDESWVGRRVCVEPTLCCEVRGIAPPCDRCREGLFGACENFAAAGLGTARLPAGTSIGYNARTGGAFGESFVAHHSRLVEVPEQLSDEQAVLTDPTACALHAVLRAQTGEARRILVYGAGALGLAVVASLRAVGCNAHVDALDLHEYLGELALAMGADRFVRLPAAAAERFGRIAELTGGTVQRARFGNYMLSGGYDVVFECVGTRRSIEESLKWTRSRGKMVQVATGSGRGVDLTPVWFTELTVLGAYGRQIESFQGERINTYALVHRLMAAGKLGVGGMLTHTFRLADYRRAFEVGLSKPRHRAVKVAFDLREGKHNG